MVLLAWTVIGFDGYILVVLKRERLYGFGTRHKCTNMSGCVLGILVNGSFLPPCSADILLPLGSLGLLKS